MTDVEPLKRRIEITKNSRYLARDRLRRRHKSSAYLTAMLSLFVIAISLIPNFLQLNHGHNQILLACVIVLSVFIIILSLMEGSESFQHQAEVLHESVRGLSRLYSRLSNLDPAKPEYAANVEAVASEYEKLLDSFRHEQAASDYWRARAHKPALFPVRYRVVPHFHPLRAADWLASVAAEYCWMVIPAIVVLAAGYVIIRYVVLNAPPLH